MPKWAVPSEHGGGGRLGGEAVDGLELHDPLTHRLHDPPAADGGAQRDRRRGHDDDPGQGTSTVGDDARREQRQGDDAHRLLGVVGAVGEGHVAGREDLRACGSSAWPSACAASRWKSRASDDHEQRARPRNPMTGEVTIGMSTLSTMPWTFRAPDAGRDDGGAEEPADERVAGRAGQAEYHHVMRFQTMAPMSAAATMAWSWSSSSTSPDPMVLATAVPANAPMKLKAAAMQHRDLGPEGARGDRRGDGVRGVVEAVDVVEDDGEHDDDEQADREALRALGTGPPLGVRGPGARLGGSRRDRTCRRTVNGRAASRSGARRPVDAAAYPTVVRGCRDRGRPVPTRRPGRGSACIRFDAALRVRTANQAAHHAPRASDRARSSADRHGARSSTTALEELVRAAAAARPAAGGRARRTDRRHPGPCAAGRRAAASG